MNSSSFYKARIKRLYVTSDAVGLEAVQRALGRLPHLAARAVDSLEEVPAADRNLHTLCVTAFRGATLSACPGTRVHRCCNYHTVDLYAGCPLGCSYCIMQSYLQRAPVTVYADPSPAIAAIRAQALAHRHLPLRVGSGETGDSLLYDPLFEITRRYISELADLDNVYFEAKTKTDFVDQLLDIEPKGNAVIGFSVNAPRFAAEEGASAPLAARLQAAQRAARAGFLVAFHFDPLFGSAANGRSGQDGNRDAAAAYARVAAQLAAAVPAERVAWISLGTVRYTPALKAHISRPYIHDEFVCCADGKFRYIQRERVALYRSVVQALREYLRPIPPIYLCMESDAVWYRVFGSLPQQIDGLRTLFAAAPQRGEELP
ncbi:MAG: radical SAM protein [Spirochaetaceae bacterium]|nr:MAG: radical SAM protein [Spirochaetaceae bacterium]